MPDSSSKRPKGKWKIIRALCVLTIFYGLGWWSCLTWNATAMRVIHAVQAAVRGDSPPSGTGPLTTPTTLQQSPQPASSPVASHTSTTSHLAMSPTKLSTPHSLVQNTAGNISSRARFRWTDGFVLNDMRFQRIPAGSMTLGSRPDESSHQRATAIQEPRWVYIQDDFWILTTEVTQHQYESLTNSNPSIVFEPDHPVTNVTVGDVMKLIEQMNQKYPQCVFSLPTSDEFEYAARVGSADDCPFPIPTDSNDEYRDAFRKFNDGDSEYLARFISRYARFNATGTAAVAQFQPNASGLYDMSGNVWEWCLPSESSPSHDHWPIVGGGWSSPTVWAITTATRDQQRGLTARESIGFRLIVRPI